MDKVCVQYGDILCPIRGKNSANLSSLEHFIRAVILSMRKKRMVIHETMLYPSTWLSTLFFSISPLLEHIFYPHSTRTTTITTNHI